MCVRRALHDQHLSSFESVAPILTCTFVNIFWIFNAFMHCLHFFLLVPPHNYTHLGRKNIVVCLSDEKSFLLTTSCVSWCVFAKFFLVLDVPAVVFSADEVFSELCRTHNRTLFILFIMWNRISKDDLSIESLRRFILNLIVIETIFVICAIHKEYKQQQTLFEAVCESRSGQKYKA